MVASSTTTRPRGWSGLLASLSTMLMLSTLATAQTPKAASPGTPAAASDAPATTAATEGEDTSNAAKGTVDTTKAQRSELEERFKDPRVDALMGNSFPQLFPTARGGGVNDDRRVAAMAAKGQPLDIRFLGDYVKFQLSQLTIRANIDAMLKTDTSSDGVKAIEAAGANLVAPLITANQADNQPFRTEFTRALVTASPDILKNHLYARVLFMVALSRSQDPLAAPVFLSVLDDAQQPTSLKLLAATGLANLQSTTPTARWGGDSTPADGMKAARALIGFLESEPDAFWPAQVRALEALGYSRQASGDIQQPKGEFAVAAMKLLADPRIHPAIRTQAAWALSVIHPNPQLSNYNFRLIVQHAGLLAVLIGDQILSEIVDPLDSAGVRVYQDRVRRRADLLMQLDLAFDGDTSYRSGFLPNAGAQRRTIDPIAVAVKQVTAAAVDLAQALPAQLGDRRAAFGTALDGLRSALAQPVGDTALFQGGPQFPPVAVPDGTTAGRTTARAVAPGATTSRTATPRR